MLEDKFRLRERPHDENVHQNPAQAKPPHSQSPYDVLLHFPLSFMSIEFFSTCSLSVCDGLYPSDIQKEVVEDLWMRTVSFGVSNTVIKIFTMWFCKFYVVLHLNIISRKNTKFNTVSSTQDPLTLANRYFFQLQRILQEYSRCGSKAPYSRHPFLSFHGTCLVMYFYLK